MASKKVMLSALALMLCVPLAACSSSMPAASEPWDSAGGADRAMQESLAYDGDAADSMSSMTSQSERSVISTGDLSLEVDDVVSARDQVVATIEGMGGHVESQQLNGREATSGYLTVRVPAAQFDRAVDSLSEIGTVLNDSRSSQDVTMQHVDLQARVNALEASIDRLTELMRDASSTADLLQAEEALSQRQAERDSLTSQLMSLENEIDESTIWVSLETKSALPGGPANFWDGLGAGWASLVAAASGALVLLGVLLPWFVVVGIIALGVIWVVRSSRKRKASRASNASATPTTDPQSAATPGATTQDPPQQAG